jgi:hypothetical protein
VTYIDSSEVDVRELFRRVVITALALSAWVPMARAQTMPRIVGVWTLNTAKSNLPAFPAGWFEIRQYSVRPDGYLLGVLFTSNARGYHYLQFTARSDGADYPEYTDDLLADLIASSKPTSRTYAEKIVDEYVTEWTDKANGKVTGSGRKIVSKDGQTLTVTVDGSAVVRIYDRQVPTTP